MTEISVLARQMQIIFVARPKRKKDKYFFLLYVCTLNICITMCATQSRYSVVCTKTEHAYDDLHYNSKLMYTIRMYSLHTRLSLLLFSDAISHTQYFG